MIKFIKVSLIFIVFSFIYANESDPVARNKTQNNIDTVPEKQLIQSEVNPIDIEQIKKLRFEKSLRAKKYSDRLLRKHKEKKSSMEEFFKIHESKVQQDDVIKAWSKDIRSKFPVSTINNDKKIVSEKAVVQPKTIKKDMK